MPHLLLAESFFIILPESHHANYSVLYPAGFSKTGAATARVQGRDSLVLARFWLVQNPAKDGKR
ncbi:MAG: hypothetical protein H6671_16480 [Anaerolineaceae bacterium]|nr:hypothetical protein [Anaerolineaceae bacterium]